MNGRKLKTVSIKKVLSKKMVIKLIKILTTKKSSYVYAKKCICNFMVLLIVFRPFNE